VITHRLLAVAFTVTTSLSGSAAFADWDDTPTQQAEPASQVQEQAPVQVKPKYQEPTWQGRRAPTPDKKYRIQMVKPTGANVPPGFLIPVVVEDTRGPKPTYGGGFGNLPAANASIVPPPSAFSVLPSTMPRAAASTDPMFQRVGDKGFFGGMRPTGYQVDASELKPQLPEGPPEWAKDRIKKPRIFVEGQEHFGNEDPQGFF